MENKRIFFNVLIYYQFTLLLIFGRRESIILFLYVFNTISFVMNVAH